MKSTNAPDFAESDPGGEMKSTNAPDFAESDPGGEMKGTNALHLLQVTPDPQAPLCERHSDQREVQIPQAGTCFSRRTPPQGSCEPAARF